MSTATAVEEKRVRNIIIVEDDEDIADSIRYNLEREGFRVRVAVTGEEALNLILAGPPGLILLDLNLPGMNGFEICRRLRAESATSKTPILMLTARAEETDKVLGLNMGADDYITKPFEHARACGSGQRGASSLAGIGGRPPCLRRRLSQDRSLDLSRELRAARCANDAQGVRLTLRTRTQSGTCADAGSTA